MKYVLIKYSIGYGSHTYDLEFEDDASEGEIEESVKDMVMERVEWSYTVSAEPS